MFIFPARVAEQSALMAGLSLPEALIFPVPESMVLIRNRRITVKKKFKNAEMDVMINHLKPVLSHRDKIGYIAARNYRILAECLTEYQVFRNGLIEKYGEETKDGNGRSIIGVKVDSPDFQKFCDELAPFNEMSHEVELMTAKYEEAIGCLSGEELLGLDWMFED